MTTQGLTTCLWYDGQAEDAANYYTSIFEDSKLGRVTRYTDAGPGPVGTVVTVEFELNGQKFVALNGGPQFKFNESISFEIHCADQDEVDFYWSKLSEGGEEGPLRLVEGQVRHVLAGHPQRAHRHDQRPGPGEGEARHRGDARDAQARHRRAPESVLGRMNRARGAACLAVRRVEPGSRSRLNVGRRSPFAGSWRR